MNKVYIYDGDFVSLLKLIYYLVNNRIKPDDIKDDMYFPSLLEEVINLSFDNQDEVIKIFVNSFGKDIFKTLYYVFLSSDDRKELIIYYFCLNAFKYGKSIIYRRNLKCVSEVLRISEYVNHENHKFKGFLRFRELENKVLYAEIEPVNNILYFLTIHFMKRLKNEYFIIKDVGRGILSIYDKNKFVIVREDEFLIATDSSSEEEKKIEELWKLFYNTIGISARKNDRCRMNFMPKRYWKHMLEVRDLL